MTIRQLPVNSSLPLQITIASPAGKTRADTIRAADGLVMSAEATDGTCQCDKHAGEEAKQQHVQTGKVGLADAGNIIVFCNLI